MKARPRFSPSRLIVMLTIIMLSACHGGGGNGAAVPLPTTFLTVGVPIRDTVFLGGFNVYSVSVIPGALYKISITALTDDADLLFFGTDSTFTVLSACAVDNTAIPGFANEDCIAAAAGSTLFLGVDGTFLTTQAGVYTIDVELLAVTNLDVTNVNLNIPVSGVTTKAGAVVYSLPSSLTNAAYTIGITGLTDDADLSVFGNDGTFASLAACSIDNTFKAGTRPEDCTLTSSGGALYFVVDGIFSTASTVSYTALAAAAPGVASPADEGSIGTPVDIFIHTPETGQVGFAGTSFYRINGLTGGTHYTVSIIGLTGDSDLTVYDSDGTFTTPANASCLIKNTALLGTRPEDCTLQVSGSILYFSIKAFTTSGGAAYIILVEPGP